MILMELFKSLIMKQEDPFGMDHIIQINCGQYPDLNLKEIVKHDFPAYKYDPVYYPKTQATIHHTASGAGVSGDIEWWKNMQNRVSTSLILDRDGILHQLYWTRYWGYHLGVEGWVFKQYKAGKVSHLSLNQKSVAVEIDSWGPLLEKANKWYPIRLNKITNKYEADTRAVPINKENIQFYSNGFREFEAYEAYTDSEIFKLMSVLIYLNNQYKIPLDYHEDMWDVSQRALNGEPGIWSHVSYVPYKFDCHPQPNFVEHLQKIHKCVA